MVASWTPREEQEQERNKYEEGKKEEEDREREGRTPPCVRSKRLRVYRQNARMLNTCGRLDSTHGGVLDVHGFSRVPSRATHTDTHAQQTHIAHQYQHPHRTTQHTTTQKHKTHIARTHHTQTPRHFHSTRENSPSPDKVCDDRFVLVKSVDERDHCLLKMYFVVYCCNSRSQSTCLDHFTRSHLFFCSHLLCHIHERPKQWK